MLHSIQIMKNKKCGPQNAIQNTSSWRSFQNQHLQEIHLKFANLLIGGRKYRLGDLLACQVFTPLQYQDAQQGPLWLLHLHPITNWESTMVTGWGSQVSITHGLSQISSQKMGAKPWRLQRDQSAFDYISNWWREAPAANRTAMFLPRTPSSKPARLKS